MVAFLLDKVKPNYGVYIILETKIISITLKDNEPVAQLVEHLTFNHVVPGSSPGGLTTSIQI
jgi:hypothetical protein